ncbi:cytochrome P450 3A4 [Polyplosphaeria fusca]|uniref:Cytochrome P450 3A4 n=1 Tax=Polyplosphaeria fusca TaxID=682080 RepID=A0A9P4R696_9PLEO|nr:cytochrome P450 3A4 [Polyplosphaeria fusca]
MMEGPGPVHLVLLSLLESIISLYVFLPSRTLSGLFLIFATINFSAYVLYHLIIYPFFRNPLRHLPKPPHGFYPIAGHGFKMFQRPPGSSELAMIKDTPNDGLVFFHSFFHEGRLILTSPSALAEVLVHKSYDFEKPIWVRAFLEKFLGHGLLTTEGEEHKYQRKQIMPAFSFRHIKELYPIFWTKSIELCEVIKKELLDKPDKVLEFNHFTQQATLDIIGLAGLGRDIASLRNADDLLIKNYEEILEPTAEKGVYFVLHLLFPAWVIKALPWKLNERVRVTTGEIKRICREFLLEKKARMKLESEEQVDILSILLRSNNFSDDGLIDQLLTFLAAGHETTSSALTWASHLLATHPTAQSRLRAEIHAHIPDPKLMSSPSFDAASLLESLPFLNAVCNETLRLYPSIPVSSRVASRDTSINGHFVPKGTMSIVVPWAINRSPTLWGPNADQFVPERWLDAAAGDKANYMGGAESNYAFLTFLHGPRSCIGEKFARGELRALLAAFVGCFEFEMEVPGKEVRAGGTITSKPIDGMRLRLRTVEWVGEGAGT